MFAMLPGAERRPIVCLLVADILVIPIPKTKHDFNTQAVTIQARFCLTVSDLRCYTVGAFFEVVKPFQINPTITQISDACNLRMARIKNYDLFAIGA